jgi:hypothetical protein
VADATCRRENNIKICNRRNWLERFGLDSARLRQSKISTHSCQRINVASGSIKGENFLSAERL